jgi:hypothetical protein
MENSCCDAFQWTPAADLGHGAGCDFDLGRCASCGAHWMAIFAMGWTNYAPVTAEEAAEMMELRAKPAELKRRLREWLDL